MAKPKIRFNGYTEDWEQRKLDDVFKEYSEKNHTELPALTIIQGGGTVKREESDRNLMYDESNLSNYKMVRKNDFIVHLRSFEGGLEKSSLDGIISPAYHTFHSDVADSRFYYSYFRSHEFIKHKLVPHVYGIRDGRSIDITGMKTIEIPYTSMEEQRKIGDYLEFLDHLITLHQRKCEQTKTLKKYMLQKMFPQDGEKVPQIRFEGFTEDWEQRKLGDLTKELSDYATMASGLPLLTSSRSGLMYQSDFRDRKTTTSDETLFSIVPKGSCTYRHMSDDDIFHLNINVLEKGLVSREYPVFISSEDNDLEFIIQHINSSDRFRGFCKGQKKGGTRTRLYYKTLCEFEMMTPLIEEQKKISATLHNLDHLITLHQRKCDELKEVKKFMLQNMFV